LKDDLQVYDLQIWLMTYKSGPSDCYNLRRQKCSCNSSLIFIAPLYWSTDILYI